MTEWTIEDVAARFEEAASTARRLPPVRVQGYFNCWPEIKRMPWENMGAEPQIYRFPPDPASIERMLEAMRWVQWLEVEQRHLVWMRSNRYRWEQIGRRFACAARTAQRRYDAAIHLVALHLNKGH